MHPCRSLLCRAARRWGSLLAMAALVGATAARAQASEEVPTAPPPQDATPGMLDVAAPARVDGLWCGVGLLQGATLRLRQKFQVFDGTLTWRTRSRELTGRIAGNELRTEAGRHGELVLRASGDTLRVTGAQGNLALAQGQGFQRSAGGSCT